MLVPYSWFQILWYFYIYGFLGWCSEVAFAAIAHGKFVNRGFVNGPICSIYGFGVMSVLLVLGPLKSSLWLLFGGSVLFTSAIEYLTGWVLEKVFHDKWWDYSKRPLNIKGYVCLEFSVLWGIACVFVVDVFQPLVAKVVDLIPKKLGWVLLGTFSALWIADNIITAMEIRKLPKKLRALQAIEDSLTAISDEIGEEIYIRASDAKDRGMEVYTGMKEKSTELAQKRAEASIEEFDRQNDRLFISGWRSQFLSGLMMPLMSLVGNMGYVGVVVVGAQLALTGNATPGDIQSFIQYVRNFTQPVQQLGNVSNTMQSMAAATERVFEFLAAPEEEQKADAQIPEKRPGHVEFDHVKFGYTPDKTIIHDFSCEAQPGQTIAIVGPTGAGKTTLIKLLQRFYDVDGGSLRVEGVDVRDWDRAALRGEFAMVLQDTWLFNGTIRENIRYGRPDASDAEVEAAARAARCDHFIHTLAGGYDFMINEEGTNLSQGQRQLVTIARAILADRPALILDEATSNVDTRTEELIQRAMDALMQGRTSFVIAHRLSTIRNADVILVIRDGDIVEKGTHDELLAQGGFYADLYNSQFDEAA